MTLVSSTTMIQLTVLNQSIFLEIIIFEKKKILWYAGSGSLLQKSFDCYREMATKYHQVKSSFFNETSISEFHNNQREQWNCFFGNFVLRWLFPNQTKVWNYIWNNRMKLFFIVILTLITLIFRSMRYSRTSKTDEYQ